MSVIIANATGEIDSSYHTLVRHIGSPIPIVMVSWSENFVFNEALLGIKDYVLCCFSEYGWNFDLTKTGSHIWGVNSERFERYYHGDWIKFDNWVKENPPKVILKRELLKRDVTETTLPIEYPCLIRSYRVVSKDEFDNRAVNVLSYWGRSNECRMRIHGEIWLHAFNKGFQPCDNLYYLNKYLVEERGEKWVSMWIPHWARVDVKEIIEKNNQSKLSLSWPGAGFKCFRTSESPVNSVMVTHLNEFAWTHDWNSSNCILVEPEKEIEGIEAALQNTHLYQKYLEGLNNVDKYRLENYIPHLEKTINEHI